MELPHIRTVRKGEVKIGNNTIEFIPWSNKDMLIYENMKEEKESKIQEEKDKLVQRKLIMDIIYSTLVKPNVLNLKDELTPIEKEVVFVEMYKLSRGNFINLTYKCTECKHTSDIQFDINKDYKFHPLKKMNIKTKDLEIKLKMSNYKPTEDDDSMLYYVSFIEEFKYNNNTFINTSNTELAEWFANELDEINFKEFIESIIDVLPKVEFSKKVKCEMCENTSMFQFMSLPDFSLTSYITSVF